VSVPESGERLSLCEAKSLQIIRVVLLSIERRSLSIVFWLRQAFLNLDGYTEYNSVV